jgi:hypothetical protein
MVRPYDYQKIYTGEDLKRDTLRGVIFNRYRYRAIEELKCPILILQWCKRFKGFGVLNDCIIFSTFLEHSINVPFFNPHWLAFKPQVCFLP